MLSSFFSPKETNSPETKLQKKLQEKDQQKSKEKTSKEVTVNQKEVLGKQSEKGSLSKKGKGGQEKKNELKGGNSGNEVVLVDAVKEPALVPAQDSNPKISELPKKKVVQFMDPDSEALITVREDLVIMMQPSNESYCFVQHADGTQIFSEQKELTIEKEKSTSCEHVPVSDVVAEERPPALCNVHHVGLNATLNQNLDPQQDKGVKLVIKTYMCMRLFKCKLIHMLPITLNNHVFL